VQSLTGMLELLHHGPDAIVPLRRHADSQIHGDASLSLLSSYCADTATIRVHTSPYVPRMINTNGTLSAMARSPYR